MSGSFQKSNASTTLPDYSGSWDFSFYDDAGVLQGKKTLNVSEDGSISGKAILNLSNVIYNTEVDGTILPNGRISDGSLTDTDKLDMVGVLTGTFTREEGNGKWKNYYNKSGTWKAIRSEKQR